MLDFTVADAGHPAWRSPLRRALAAAPAGIRDITADATETIVERLGPEAGVAGIEIEGAAAARLLARLTALDLEQLPAVGAVAEVRMLLERPEPRRFRLWFGQELSDYVAEVVLDTAEGLVWE